MAVQSYFVRYATYLYIFDETKFVSVRVKKGWGIGEGAALQVFHKNIQNFGTPF